MAMFNEAAAKRVLREGLDGRKVGSPLEVQQTDFSRDAFSRQRVSNNNILGIYQHLNSDLPLLMNSQTGSLGSNSVEFVKNKAMIRMRVANATNETVIRQSKKYHRYLGGQSQFIATTFASGTQQTGITKEVGYYDDDNGLFLRIPPPGQEPSFVIRTNTTGTPTERVFPQSEWNRDKLNGTGRTGFALDFSKTQIFVIDFQWLGSGRVRFGFDLNGDIIYAHEVNNANEQTDVYMSTPSLPVRYLISNDGTGTGAEFHQICSTVVREGGQGTPGSISVANTTSISGTTTGQSAPTSVLSVRLKSSFTTTTSQIKATFPYVFNDGENVKFSLVLNPQFSDGELTGSWTSFSPAMEQNEQQLTYVTGSGTRIGVSWRPIIPGAGPPGSTQVVVPGVLSDLISNVILATDIQNDSDVLSVIVENDGSGADPVAATIFFIEED